MEGWAEADTAERVDKLLEEYPNLVYMKRDATIDDDAPVKLKNNKFAKLFELIGSMYALPKYGTLDLTAIFGPFYMLFFAICLCDAGYGLVLLLAGLALLKKDQKRYGAQPAAAHGLRPGARTGQQRRHQLSEPGLCYFFFFCCCKTNCFIICCCFFCSNV